MVFISQSLLTLVQALALAQSVPFPAPAAASPLDRRAIDASVLLANGKAAQKLNAKFASMTSDSTCQTGDMACIAGAFSQCVGGKYVGGPCAATLKCFAMPLLLKEGTTLGCDTEADVTARIANTGATGGLTGDGSSGGNTTAPAAPSSQAQPAMDSGSDMGMSASTPSTDGGKATNSSSDEGESADDAALKVKPTSNHTQSTSSKQNATLGATNTTASSQGANSTDGGKPSGEKDDENSCR